MKLSCTPISFQHSLKSGEMDFRNFFTFCAKQKLEGADILDPEPYPWFWGEVKDVAEGMNIAAGEGVAIAAWACGNNFAKTNKSERQKQVDSVRRAIDRASEAGAPRIRIFGGYQEKAGGEAGVTTSTGLGLVLDALTAVLPYATEAKVVLAIENHGLLPGHSYESLALIRHFDSPWLKATFDPANCIGNTMDEPEDPLRACDILLDVIDHVHFKDMWPARLDKARRMEPCPAGLGLTPIRQVAAKLVLGGFREYCSLEYEASSVLPEAEGVTQSLDYLREAIRCATFPASTRI